MWNGWATGPGVLSVFSIHHSSTESSVTVLVSAGSSENCLLSIWCFTPGEAVEKVTRRGLFAVPHGDLEFGSTGMQCGSVGMRAAFASWVVILVRNGGGSGAVGMNSAR